MRLVVLGGCGAWPEPGKAQTRLLPHWVPNAGVRLTAGYDGKISVAAAGALLDLT